MTWDLRPLGEMCAKIVKSDPKNTGRSKIRYIDIGSVDGIRHRLGDVPEIDAGTAPSRCRQIVMSGDTIFSTVRPYLEKIAYIGDDLDGEFSSTGFCVLRPNGEVDPRFLFFFSISPVMLGQIFPLQKGVSYPAVLDKEVRSVLMPVPPLGEQRRIVAILEEYLSHLDAADVILEKNNRRMESLRDKLVHDAVTGVSAGDRSAKELADVGVSDGDLPPLPDGWEWSRLGSVADVVGGVTKDAKKQGDPSYVEVPYLRVANVQRGYLKLDEVTAIRVPPVKADKLRLRPGDVLLNEGGDRDKLARGWVWEGQIEDCIHQNHVFRARVTEPRLTPEFLSFTANSIGGPWAERNGKQSVNLASISLKMIRNMPVIVPSPGAAQHAVDELQVRLAGISRLQEGIVAAQRRSTSLRRSLLHAAFTGRLTEQSASEMVAVAGA